jgi:hypothetical protein
MSVLPKVRLALVALSTALTSSSSNERNWLTRAAFSIARDAHEEGGSGTLRKRRQTASNHLFMEGLHLQF